jgi:hypothetical protein
MKWFLKGFLIAKTEKKKIKIAKSLNSGFQCVANIYIYKRMVQDLYLNSVFIAIFWLNLPRDDYHFSYKQKFLIQVTLL